MEDNVDVLRQAEAKMRIPDVARHHLDLRSGGQLLKPSPGIEGVVLAQGHYPGALFHQGLRQVRPDEALGACYQNSLSL